MNLQHHLQLQLSSCNLSDIAQFMGYSKSKSKQAAKRIDLTLSDESLGLYCGSYDFKYTSEEFLKKLCQVLSIDPSVYQSNIDEIHRDHADRMERFKSYVFVDTGFRREGQPIAALVMCENQRRIYLDYKITKKPIYEQVEYVQSLVQRHYAGQSGVLGIWGDIKKYIFIYADDLNLALSVDGVIINKSNPACIPSTKITGGNSDISHCFKQQEP